MTNNQNKKEELPALLVPISVNALALGSQNQDLGNGFADLRANYSLLNNGQFLGAEIQPDVFTKSSYPGNGVHLQWSLPDALTHGHANESNNIEYPIVPNRWLVVRINANESNTSETLDYKSWIIESDCLTDPIRSSGNDSDYTLLPAFSGNGVDVFYDTYYTRLGQSFNYPDGYPSTNNKYLDRITALGPGDPSFASYYQASKSVFGFHDSLEALDNGNLTYMVLGWYDNSSQDILHQKPENLNWKSYLEDKLNWSLPPNTIYPSEFSGTVCQGIITNIDWQGLNAKYPGGPPINPNIQVALGNTSVEALAALIKKELPNETNIDRILEAFQYDLLAKLDQPDGIAQLEMALHNQEFQAFKGGLVYNIERQTGSDHQEMRSPNMPFPQNIGSQLNSLNDQQREIETQKRDLVSYQSDVYLAWYQYFQNAGGGPGPSFGSAESGPSVPGSEPGDGNNISLAQAKEVIDPLIKKITDIQSAITKAQEQSDKTKTALSSAINVNMPGYILKEISGQRFWRPTDPVVLISGLDRSFRNGEDGRFDNDNKHLLCRLDNQVITAIEVKKNNTDFAKVTATILKNYYPSDLTSSYVPNCLQSLFMECFLLNNNMAEAIAIEAYKIKGTDSPTKPDIAALTPDIIQQQNGIWNASHNSGINSQKLASNLGFSGTVPSKVSFDIWTENPWNPLFMEWEINYFPTNTQSLPTNPSTALKDWLLEENDFSFKGNKLPNSAIQEINGRTLLTPHAIYNFQATLKKYLANHANDPEFDELKKITTELSQLDILSQSFGGFNDAMLMKELDLQFPVMAPADIYDSETHQLAKSVKDAVGDTKEYTPNSSTAFNPFRQGFFSVLKLWIVDSFGQILPLDNLEKKYAPVLSEQLTTEGSSFDLYGTLRPRLSQAMRLDFRWCSSNNDTLISNSDPATSPICGWVIFNHLDSNMQVYDSNGIPLGSLALYENKSETLTRWEPVPGALNQTESPLIENIHLANFINGLLIPSSETSGAFKQLMSNIDTIQTTINPAGDKFNGNLAVLMGNPLAVTRASLDFTLESPPSYSLSLDDYGAKKTNKFTKVNIPVRLGDTSKVNDGLMGYFISDDYSNYYTTWAPSNNNSSYLKANNLVEVSLSPKADPVYVTMLVDPKAGVHANCGMLPVKYIDVPNQHIENALENMSVTFLTSPLLSNPDSFAVPVPSENNKQWSWVYPPTTDSWNHISDFNPIVTNASFINQLPTILEGWLKLSPDKGLILQFGKSGWGVLSGGAAGNMQLNAVAGTQSNNLIAVGVQKQQQANLSTETISSLILRNNGNDWFVDPSMVLDNVSLNAIYKPARDQYFIAGNTKGNNQTPLVLICESGIWTQMNLPVTNGQLYSIWGTNSNQVFAAGADKSGKSMMLSYNGSTWQKETIPDNGTIYKIQGTSSSNVFAVGDAFVLQFDGTTWQQVTIPEMNKIRGLWAMNQTNIYITGSSTTNQPAILKFIGNDWITIDCLPEGQNTLKGTLSDIWGQGDGTLTTVGHSEGSPLILSFDGKKWSAEKINTGSKLNSLIGLSQESIITVGE